MTTELVLTSLRNALKKTNPLRGLIHHSDRGVQYTSKDYRKYLDKHGFICSMSRKENCYDNARIESFWGTLKKELIYPNQLMTREQTKLKIVHYSEVFYNRKRINSTKGFLTPIEMENKCYRKSA